MNERGSGRKRCRCASHGEFHVSSSNHGNFVPRRCKPERWAAGRWGRCRLLDRLWVYLRGFACLSGARWLSNASYKASSARHRRRRHFGSWCDQRPPTADMPANRPSHGREWFMRRLCAPIARPVRRAKGPNEAFSASTRARFFACFRARVLVFDEGARKKRNGLYARGPGLFLLGFSSGCGH